MLFEDHPPRPLGSSPAKKELKEALHHFEMSWAVVKKGRVFNVEKYAVHDGPGIRTVVFFKGCPLHCWWCHNPEGQNLRPELVYRETRCIGCGECVKNCPRKALSLVSQHATLNRKICDTCGICAQTCPSEALSIVGKDMSVEEVIREIETDRIFYDESEGGVTFSGGEPLLQPSFLNAILEECNERKIHTTLDTSGCASQGVVDKIRGKVDLFLYDLKIMDDANHRKYTGVSNRLILQNLQRLAKDGSNIVISIPIIPSINDDEDNILGAGEFIASLPGVGQVSLLPYHRAGVDKYRNLGRAYRLNGIRPQSSRKTRMIKERLEAFGLKVRIGGR
jgi:pyruvate formate lyase activating enzyme